MSSSVRLTPQVLAVVQLFLGEPDGVALYGCQITARTGCKSGTVNPILDRLLRQGWLADEWEERGPDNVGRPLRRYFRLTEEGRVRATSALVQLRERMLKLLAASEGRAVEVRVLTRLVEVESFEQALAGFMDSCPHVVGGYTFSVWPLGMADG